MALRHRNAVRWSQAITQRLANELERHPSRPTAKAIRDRIEGPLQVAIAGRVKAGKSTLLNALVGERLAPTDAGECTRIVSWYRKGHGYEVSARLHDGQRPDARVPAQRGRARRRARRR